MSIATVIHVGGIEVKISPFAFQHYAKDFYEAYKKHQEAKVFTSKAIPAGKPA